MADMPTDLWGGWIAVVTIVSLIALAWLVVSVYFSRQDAEEVAELNEQTWDETLREGSNPAPLWWFWFILALMVVSVAYLTLYPGLGTFRGALGWSQAGRIADSIERYEALLGPERARLAQADIGSLQGNPFAMRSARHVFMNHCAACHGPAAGGQADLFPDLTHGAWQWGGTPADIERTIRNGRQGIMPPLGAALDQTQLAAVTDFVLALSTGAADGVEEGTIADGRRVYQTFCSACHAPNGQGMTLLGAPALNDTNFVYGGTREAMQASIVQGRSGVMPGFADTLDELQIRLLVAWLLREAAE
jgi:cytochrome c oxidase cbb3-type subunit III